MGRRSDGWKLFKHQGSPYWYVRFTTLQGRRVDKSTGCKAKAAAAREAAKVYAEAVGGSGGQARPIGNSQLADLFAEWLEVLADVKSEGWADQLEMYVTAHWMPRWTWTDELTAPGAVQRYIGERLKCVSGVTVNKELCGLRRFLGWVKTQGYINEIPAWEAPEATSDYKAICLFPEQTAAVLAELPDRRTHRKHLPVQEYFTVMWATSFRRGTMARLRWDDLDLDSGVINVRPSADKKRHGRTVPLTDDAVAALKSLKDDETERIGLVFGLRDFRVSVRKAAERVGLPSHVCSHLSNHDFRHSRLTDLASRSKNIAAIQHIAGHKDLASTMRYVHGSEENTRRMLEELGELDDNSGGIVVEKRKSRPRRTG